MSVRATGLEQLLPCLIDRLTDDKPHIQAESRVQRSTTVRRYRDGVLRDLNWLLNTCSHPEPEELHGFEDVIRSVINYGIQNFGGIYGSTRNAQDIERQIRKAITDFEPRILEETLEVELVIADGQKSEHDHCMLSLEIRGELWLQPMPEQLYIKTCIDLETGACEFQHR